MPITIRENQSSTMLAQAEPGPDLIQYEGYWYFAPTTVNQAVLKVTDRTYTCPYKGTCNWVDYVDPQSGREARNVAWTYPNTKPGHESIVGRFGFYPGQAGGTRQDV